MANPEHLKILKQGVEVWNAWREANTSIKPDLREANLQGFSLNSARLQEADLEGAILGGVHLVEAQLNNANLKGAQLVHAKLVNSNLAYADLSNARLIFADLRNAILSGAILSGANLIYALFDRTLINDTDFTNAEPGFTIFSNVDFSPAKGLENIRHRAPSTIGIDTIYISAGHIPDVFLRDAGVPEEVIDIARSIRAGPAIQWHSCFISYSTKDDVFARRLHSRMREANMRVWFAPEDLKGGKKLHEQLFEAIQIYDRLLIVLSEHSIQSEWVMTEIRKARETEKKEKRRKLFPIRLTDFETLRDWTCFDADTGKDLAVEVREYFIPDFSNWKNHDAFETAFARLKKDLEAENSKK
jgi:hypothetical protein